MDDIESTTLPATDGMRRAIRALNACIEISTDGEKGYASAAADVRDRVLKALFMQYAKQRAEFVIALQDAIHLLGGSPENEGTLRGALHRGFLDARRALEGKGDRLVLIECERGERAALVAYERAFREVTLGGGSPSVLHLLGEQTAAIKGAHDVVLNRLAGDSERVIATAR